MIVSNKEILYINALIENAVDLFHNFWPMTSFIHHNPLHGFENMHFEKAIKKAGVYFHNKKFLSREQYQEFYKQGKIKVNKLEDEIRYYCLENNLDYKYEKLFVHLFLNTNNLKKQDFAQDIKNKIDIITQDKISNICKLQETKQLGINFGFCDALDSLYDTNLCENMNAKLNKVAMRHLDEGQATWKPALSEKGMFFAWKRLIKKDKQFFSTSLQICRILSLSDKPEDIIFWVLNKLKIPKVEWENFFVLQFGKLHGWTGFLRWRSTNKDYVYQKKYPAFLEEFLAIRLYFLYMYLEKIKKSIGYFPDFQRLKEELCKKESFLKIEYNSGKILPQFIETYEKAEQKNALADLYENYMLEYNLNYKKTNADFLYKLLKDFDEYFEDYNLLLKNIINYQEHEGFIYLKAMEEGYIKDLMVQILPNIQNTKLSHIDAQLFFCIDVRSEGIRRNIEENGNYETFGIGGFFGIPLKLIDISKKHESDLCPAVIKPKNVVYRFQEEDEHLSIELKKALKHMYHDLKYNTMSAYITVETIGLLFGFDFFGKSIWPNFYMPKRDKVFDEDYDAKFLIDKYPKNEILSKIKTLQIGIIKQAIKDNYALDASDLQEELDEFLQIITSHENIIGLKKGVIEAKTRLAIKLGLMHHEEVRLQKILQDNYQISYFHKTKHIEKLSKVGFTFKEQLFYAKNALVLTGLSDDFAPIVVLCGHESKSSNNPYESALDCGACGGKSSDTNAKVLTYILNKPEIRKALKPEINIPSDTIFVSALHNTVTDKVLIQTQNISSDRLDEIKTLQNKLNIATKNSALQRAKRLPQGKKLNDKKALKFIRRNTQDWSQTRPEWGLATNHSFIIGPRDISKGIKFDNRVFLHSYDYKKDKIGYYLEIILSAPLVIGEWINMEHFFSSLDNKAFGSESKIYHNVVGRFGVISGNMSDLRTGLAAQSVHLKGKIYHEPIRLITFVDAPFYKYRIAIDKIKKVSELVYNEWIKMIFIDRKEEAFFYYHGNSQKWKKIEFRSLK
jgi:uncharacterized protein YbcC (UPF0753/DUF2309 family)